MTATAPPPSLPKPPATLGSAPSPPLFSEQREHGPQSPSNIIPRPSDPTPAHSEPHELEKLNDQRILREADQAAVQGTNDGSLTWEQAHDGWEAMTKRDLSPHAFGKRILDLGGGIRIKSVSAPAPGSEQTNPNQGHIGSPRTSSTGATSQNAPNLAAASTMRALHSPLPPQPLPQQHEYPPRFAPLQQTPLPIQPRAIEPQPPYSSTPLQPGVRQTSIGSLGSAPAVTPGSDQNMLRQCQQDLDALRYDVRLMQIEMRSLTHVMQELKTLVASKGSDETVDGLFDTVSAHAVKLGELESVKVQLAALQRRANKADTASPISHNPPGSLPNGISPTMPTPLHAHAPPSAHAQLPAFTPSNTLKRHQPTEILENTKRYRTDSSTPYVSSPTFNNQERAKPSGYRFRPYDPVKQSAQPPPTGPVQVSRQSTDSDGSWHQAEGPENSSSFTPVNANVSAMSGPSTYASPPSHGRGRSTRSHDLWEHRANVPIEPAGYWRPDTHDTSDRGRIIRRGGSMMAAHGDDRGSISAVAARESRSRAKTRARPVRGADGVLRRKDGKPDMRSQSSAKNLALIQQRKKAERKDKDEDEDRRTSLTEGQSMLGDEDELAAEGEGEGDYDEYSDEGEGQIDQEAEDDGENRDPKHSKVMKQMFPNGITMDRQRMDHAAQIFSSDNTAATAKLLPRKDMAKEGAAESSPLQPDPSLSSSKPEIPRPTSTPAMSSVQPKPKRQRSWTEASAREHGYKSLHAMDVESRLAEEHGEVLTDFEERMNRAREEGKHNLLARIDERRRRILNTTAEDAVERDDEDEMIIDVGGDGGKA